MRRTLTAALLSALALTACGEAGRDVPEPDGVVVLGAGLEREDPEASAEDLRRLTRAQTAFALDLYRVLSDDVDGDLALGPGSLHTALAMIRAGAAGTTAEEMDRVLHAEDLDLHRLGNALDRELSSRSDQRGVDLSTANRVWAGKGLDLTDDYVETIATQYGAALAELDYAADPGGTRKAINAWVSSTTDDKVEELFPDGTITPETRLVLANAVHLDANWKFPFPKDQTEGRPFTLADGSQVNVPTMHYDVSLPSAYAPDWQAVRLPYNGDELAMTVIVPADLADFESRLDADLLDRVEARIKDGGIHLALPRFTARTHASLPKALQELGMTSAFGAADFSAMSDESLFLAAVEHEAVVEVDEEGTEAAAATGGVMMGSHGPTVEVNRPFLFVVRDQQTGAVLFLGRVTDPR
jgi:serpin B